MARNLQLQVILDAVDRATAPLKQITQGSAGAGAAIRQTRERLKELNDQQKRITTFQDMTRQAKASQVALGDKRKELAQLTSQIQASDNPGKRLVQQQQRAQREVDQLSKKFREQTQRSRELSRELPAKAQGIKNLGHQQSVLASEIEAANRRLAQQQTALKRLGDADVAGRLRNMNTEVGRFARRTAMLGGAAAGGIFALANSTANLGDEVAKTADKMGMQLDVFQELRYAGERGGMEIKAFDKTMLTFTRRMGHAARGTGAAVKAYDELGLSAEVLAKMKPEDALGLVADRLKDIEDHNERLSYASQIFDNAGGAAMLNVLKGGSEGLQELRGQARLTGYVLSEQAARDSEEFKDSLLNVQLGMKGMKNIIGSELMPAVKELMDDGFAWMIDNRYRVEAFARNFGARLKEAVPTILEAGRGIARFVGGLVSVVSWMARMVGGFENLAILVAVVFASKAILSVIAFGLAITKAGAAILMLAKTLPIAAGATKVLGTAFLWIGKTAIPALLASFKGLALFMLTNPIGIAIGLAVAAIYLLWKNWEGVVGGIKALWEGIGGWFGDRWAEVREAFSGGIGGISRLLLNWNPFGVLYRWMIGKLEDMGIEIPEKFQTLGGAIIDGLLGGLFGKLGKLKDGVVSIASNVGDWFKSKLGINSPSRVFAEFGVNTMEGYQQGIRKSESQPLREVATFAKRVQRAGAGVLLGAVGTVAAAMPGVNSANLPNFTSVPLDTRGPLTAGATGGMQVNLGGIHIHATPGMDEQALARHVAAEVQRALAEAQHQASVRERSAFRDTD